VEPNPLHVRLIGQADFFDAAELRAALAESDGRLPSSVTVSAATRRLFSVLSERGHRHYETTGELFAQGFADKLRARGGSIETPPLVPFTPQCSCKQQDDCVNSLFSFTLEFVESTG